MRSATGAPRSTAKRTTTSFVTEALASPGLTAMAPLERPDLVDE
jgi:hypothetical protein